jgi:beta-glucosidase
LAIVLPCSSACTPEGGAEGHQIEARPSRDKVGAAAVSLKTGMDNECIDFFEEVKDSSDYGKYLDAVKQGLLSENDMDVALKRLFTARMKLGMFDPPAMVPYTQISDSEIDSAPHRELALKIARESMVLLKNDGVLPLTDKATKILVTGPLADALEVLYGNYNGYAHATSALEGIRKQFSKAKVSYAPGTNFLRERSAVPTSALSTQDGKPGLKAEYFPTSDFSGSPLVTRVEARLFLNLGAVPDAEALSPPPGITDFSVR